MRKIVIVGAGQLGSRHLQALKAIEEPLAIRVIDPSPASLQTARERYAAIASEVPHDIAFDARDAGSGEVDIAIVATNADVRKDAIDRLLAGARVQYMILEKLLFPHRGDYAAIGDRLASTGTRAWVNCPMRVMPIYRRIGDELGAGPVHYRVTGSQFGLVTNAIHYLDHVVKLSGCDRFTVDVEGLDSAPIKSKRPGFLELNGSLLARFADGSRCEMTCHKDGTAPVVVEIGNERDRYIVRESEGKLWHAGERSNWVWTEQEARIPYQSQLTTGVVESLLATGDCGLSPYASAARTHLSLLEPLLVQVRGHAPEAAGYPFT